MNEYVQLGVALLFIFLVGFGLRWLLAMVGVEAKSAWTISAVLALGASAYLVMFFNAMRNP